MLLKTILFEDGVQIEIICDPEKPLWDQEIFVTNNGTEVVYFNLTHRNIEQEAPG